VSMNDIRVAVMEMQSQEHIQNQILGQRSTPCTTCLQKLIVNQLGKKRQKFVTVDNLEYNKSLFVTDFSRQWNSLLRLRMGGAIPPLTYMHSWHES